jgi:uncharacterized protein
MLGLSLFTVVLVLGLFATVFGFPGTVIIAVDVFLYATVTGFSPVGPVVLLIVVLLSLLAEAVDFALGMYGTVHFGTSTRDLVTATVGSCLGAVVLTPVLLGLGTLLGIFLGGFTALLLARLLQYRHMRAALRPTPAAIAARSAAVLAKGGAALAMIVVTLLNVYS